MSSFGLHDIEYVHSLNSDDANDGRWLRLSDFRVTKEFREDLILDSDHVPFGGTRVNLHLAPLVLIAGEVQTIKDLNLSMAIRELLAQVGIDTDRPKSIIPENMTACSLDLKYLHEAYQESLWTNLDRLDPFQDVLIVRAPGGYLQYRQEMDGAVIFGASPLSFPKIDGVDWQEFCRSTRPLPGWEILAVVPKISQESQFSTWDWLDNTYANERNSSKEKIIENVLIVLSNIPDERYYLPVAPEYCNA